MLLRWEPQDMDRIRRDMNRMWTWLRDEWDSDRNHPRTRLHETETTYVVEAEIPGIDPESVNVEVDAEGLSLRGPMTANPYNADAGPGEFQAAVHFPGEVDPDRAEATYRHGLLTITVPKAQSQRRRVPVRPNQY